MAKRKAATKRKGTKVPSRTKAKGKPQVEKQQAVAGEPAPAKEGSKLERIISMMKNGATLGEMSEATKWKPTSVRGVIQNAVKGRLKMTVTLTKVEDRGTVFTVS